MSIYRTIVKPDIALFPAFSKGPRTRKHATIISQNQRARQFDKTDRIAVRSAHQTPAENGERTEAAGEQVSVKFQRD